MMRSFIARPESTRTLPPECREKQAPPTSTSAGPEGLRASPGGARAPVLRGAGRVVDVDRHRHPVAGHAVEARDARRGERRELLAGGRLVVLGPAPVPLDQHLV